MPNDETFPDQTTLSSAPPAPDGSATPPAETSGAPVRRTRRRAASRPAGPPEPTGSQTGTPPAVTASAGAETASAPARQTRQAAKLTTVRRTSKKAASSEAVPSADSSPDDSTELPAPVKRSRSPRRAAKPTVDSPFAASEVEPVAGTAAAASGASTPAVFSPVFQPPDPVAATPGPSTSARGDAGGSVVESSPEQPTAPGASLSESEEDVSGDQSGTSSSARRRRSRGGRNRRKSSDVPSPESPGSETPASGAASTPADPDSSDAPEPGRAKKSSKKAGQKSAKDSARAEQSDDSGPDRQPDGSEPTDSDEGGTSSSSRRRRRRRRSGDGPDGGSDSPDTVVKIREPRPAKDSITSVEGSTRVEAKKQRRREGREAGRRRAPILSESEFLARREAVDRAMMIRQRDEVTQIAVLEDNVLVEHYVALETQSSLLGNIYLGRVQNVLPSMEAAFVDIGKGRNAVLYAGEVNWDLVGGHQPRRIENALKSGQQILVQVSKDPVGHKGARLTSQISLPGRYLVYVPGGESSGISRKLPDTERSRLKNLLKEILPDESGVIIRTAAEGASEEELTRDVERLTSRWMEIEKLVKSGKGPALLYAEPDITLKVVRDLFTEDFTKLVVSGDQAWTMVNDYVSYVAPDLTDRLERYDAGGDVFDDFRVDEQIAKALERKVWLPSGGSLVIDRTEAMTVVDVNTGKFTGSGGNLEQTVTKNNLEAAEEIVRQLRLRDIGGIIVIDFIDMVLENNRDLVLRRLVECLGRDRTRHQVAEVTSLGLVQMTRKRIGTGLVESFSAPCEVCQGRGVIIEREPVKTKTDEADTTGRTSSKRSSGRQRSAGKGEPEPERIDPHAAERHLAAAAATAAIAAALHPQPKPQPHDADQVGLADGAVRAIGDHAVGLEAGAQAEAGDQAEQQVADIGAEETVVAVDAPTALKAPKAAKASAPREAAATKKAAAKKTTSTKKTATKKTATKKTATKKKAATKKGAAKSDPVTEPGREQVPEPVGVS